MIVFIFFLEHLSIIILLFTKHVLIGVPCLCLVIFLENGKVIQCVHKSWSMEEQFSVNFLVFPEHVLVRLYCLCPVIFLAHGRVIQHLSIILGALKSGSFSISSYFQGIYCVSRSISGAW